MVVMDEVPAQQPIVQQDLVAEEVHLSGSEKKKDSHLFLSVCILIIVIVIFAGSAIIYGSRTSRAVLNPTAAANTTTIKTTTIPASGTTQSTVASTTTIVTAPSGPSAPGTLGRNTSTTSSTTITTSTVPAGAGRCPCFTEGQIVSMIAIPQSARANSTFISFYSSNISQRQQLEAQTSNGLSQSELAGISGGWSVFYTTGRNSGPLSAFNERIIDTASPSALSSTLISFTKSANYTRSTGTAGTMNYTAFIGTVAGNRNIVIIGYQGGYVTDLSILVPLNNSNVASAAAIAQNVSLSLSGNG
jgi:hypothetical protein